MISFTNIPKEIEYTRKHTNFNWYIDDIFSSGILVAGKYNEMLEAALQERFQNYSAKPVYVVLVSSGTTALKIALIHREIYHPHQVVGIPNMTFFATCEAVYHAGLIPVAQNINSSLQIEPDEHDVVVSLHGRPIKGGYSADLHIIEDNCQSGPSHFNEECYASCYSLFPSKPLPSITDGGYIVTTNKDLADYARLVRYHGIDFKKSRHNKDRHKCTMVGGTERLNEIGAAYTLCRLENYDWWQGLRQNFAYHYCENLGLKFECDHYYHIFNVFVDMRDELCMKLRERGIEHSWHYRWTVLEQLNKYQPEDFTKWYTEHCLSLPLHPFMQLGDVVEVGRIVKPYLVEYQ